jgi:hypothetical protein
MISRQPNRPRHGSIRDNLGWILGSLFLGYLLFAAAATAFAR